MRIQIIQTEPGTRAKTINLGQPKAEGKNAETSGEGFKVRQSGDEVLVDLDLKEAPEQVDISIEGRRLRVSFEKREEVRTQEGNVQRVEVRTETRVREVPLPAEVDRGNVDAVYEKGVLKVKLKKA